MKYVWLAEEYHGHNRIFSSWDLAFIWLEKEKETNVYEDDYDKLEIDVAYGVNASIYYEGDLVGKIERYTIDE